MIAQRMFAAVQAARVAAEGHEAVCVSHQLPIWTLRRYVEKQAALARPAPPAVRPGQPHLVPLRGLQGGRHRLRRAGRAPGRHVRDRQVRQGGLTVRRLAAVLAAALVAAGVAGRLRRRRTGPRSAPRPTGWWSARRTSGRRSASVTGELLDGGTYDLAQDRGKVVVVNFWGSWCAPCRAEADDLEQTYQATKAKGVSFLGVNSRDDRDAAKAFERGRVDLPEHLRLRRQGGAEVRRDPEQHPGHPDPRPAGPDRGRAARSATTATPAAAAGREDRRREATG